MHPDDEAVLVSELLRDPAVLFIDGPRWKSATPLTTRDIFAVGSYCIIWSPEDLRQLAADFMPTANDWYCRSEYATIQFLRSSITDTAITDGRLAIGTGLADKKTAESVEGRYKVLSRAIKNTYRNSIVRWRYSRSPKAPANPSSSANVGKPDNSLWVGPAAMAWLAADPARHIKNVAAPLIEGTIS
jgi:hypothetical protein